MAETIKIQKIKVAGKAIYPATILDAVKDATAKITVNGELKDNPSFGKTLREIIVDNEKVTASALIELDSRAGKLADLDTTEKGSLVGAINEVASSASGATGDLNDLTTDAKDDVVSAINELDAAIDKLNGASTVEGSVDAKVAALKKEIMTGEATGTVAEAYDTLKEVADWISANDANGEATGLTKQVAANTAAIGAKAVAALGTVGEEGYVAPVAATGLYKEIEDAIDAASHAKTTVVTGTANGTVAVDGTDVAVKGLGSAAYTEAIAYDASGAAATAEQNAKDYADGLATNYDAVGAADTAELNAKDYADGLATNYDEAGAAAAVQGNTIKTVKDLVDEIGEEGVAESVDGAGDGKAATGIYAKIDAAKAAAIAAQHSKTTVTAGTVNGTISVDGGADVTIYAPVTAAPSSTTTDAQLATAKGVYDYALTAEAVTDTTEYADVF